jgi:hypothetical protein
MMDQRRVASLVCICVTLLRNMNSLRGDAFSGDGHEQGYLHDRDGENVGKDDQKDDIVVIVPKVPVPVVNGARCAAWFQTIPTKDIHERGNNKEEDHEPGTDKEE